jgi:hypothetical protein
MAASKVIPAAPDRAMQQEQRADIAVTAHVGVEDDVRRSLTRSAEHDAERQNQQGREQGASRSGMRISVNERI